MDSQVRRSFRLLKFLCPAHWNFCAREFFALPSANAMPKCCSCNSSGTCKTCSCVRGRRRCSDCVPSRHGRCTNLELPGNTPNARPASTARKPVVARNGGGGGHQVRITSQRYSSSSPSPSSFVLPSSQPSSSPPYLPSSTVSASSQPKRSTAAAEVGLDPVDLEW